MQLIFIGLFFVATILLMASTYLMAQKDYVRSMFCELAGFLLGSVMTSVGYEIYCDRLPQLEIGYAGIGAIIVFLFVILLAINAMITLHNL